MKKILLVVVALLVVAGAGYLTACPCGPVPGAWLFGEEATKPVDDWSFVNDRATVPLCQIEVSTWRPHSINLNCMADSGELFVSCSNCADKQWSKDVLVHPAGKLRAAGTVFPVTFERVTESGELDRIWRARLAKVAQGNPESSKPSPRPDHWWGFQLRSRGYN